MNTATKKIVTTNQPTIAPTTEYVQLCKLTPSELNVRTVETNKTVNKELLASIRAKGLIQNLVIIKQGKKFGVVAGRRRYDALNTMLDAKEIDKTYPVNCLIAKDEKEAIALSLVENTNRAPMHPVDELKAYKSLIEAGSTIGDISLSFGKSKPHVKRVLALANVHPKILAEFQKGEINLDCVEAFTVADNQDKQLECFEALDWYQPNTIRKMLTESGYPKSEKICNFIGVKAYKDKNGAITSDLFQKVDYFADGDLVRNIAFEKLKNASDDAGERNLGYRWLSLDIKGDFDPSDYEQMRGDYRGLPKGLEKKISDQKDFIAGLEWNDKRADEAEELLEALKTEKAQHLYFSNAQKKHSGIVVTYDNKGVISFHRGLTREDDMKTYLESLKKPKSDDNDDIQDVEKVEEKGLSQALKDSLLMHDQQLTQLNMLQNPQLSARAYLFDTCYQILSESEHWRHGKYFDSTTKYKINHNDDLLINTEAYKAIKKLEDSINTDWLKDTVQESYSAFIALTLDEQNKLFGQAVALSSNTSKAGCGDNSIYQQVQDESKFDKSKYFTPTKANYFGRLKLEALQELCLELFGDDWMEERNKLARGKLAVNAEESYAKLEKQDFLPEMLK